MLIIQTKYLIDEVISLNRKINYQLEINNDIEIYFNNSIDKYSESIFDFNKPELSIEEIQLLNHLTELICSEEKSLFDIPADLYQFLPFLKIIHFFVNEFYIINKEAIDSHERITAKNVNPVFNKILTIPVTDVLIDLFLIKNKIHREIQKELYFTSDFDMTNIWVKLGLLRSIKRLLTFPHFSLEFKSFLNSKSNLKFNYILTDKMFCFDYKANYKITNIAFWLVDRNNKNLDFKNQFKAKSFKEFIQQLNNKVLHGLHLSYNTSVNKSKIGDQSAKFHAIFNQNPSVNRYHYLKYNLPEDFILLEKNNIKMDFSYCFPDSLLFRGGRTVAVKFWSFEENRSIDVISYPIFFMDVMFSTYLKTSLNDAEKMADKKIVLFKKYGKTCVLLWHNNNMYEFYEKKNYHPELFNHIKNKLLTDEKNNFLQP